MEKIDSRSQMIYAVTEVAMLEHTLMCYYLHAASTFKIHPDEFGKSERRFHQAELARDWKRSLLIVAREEMQHMTYALNLLVSIGGVANFSRPNFPLENRFYKGANPTNGPMTLEKVTLDTIYSFIKFEAPPPNEMLSELLILPVPDPNVYKTLNEFYNEIKRGLKDSYFIGSTHEYDPVDENRENIRVKGRKNVATLITSKEDAIALIDMIIEEGEGSSSEDPQAHYVRFLKIATEWEEELKVDCDFDPTRNILPNTMTRYHDDHDTSIRDLVTVIKEDTQLPYNILQLFNGAYEVLLTWLYQVFNRLGTKEELFAIETLAFFPYMTEVIRPLMEILTRIPVDESEGKMRYLSATFEVTSNNFMVPREEVTLKMTEERLDDLISLGKTCLEQLKYTPKALIKDFEFVLDSLVTLTGEFKSRIRFGWPPPLDISRIFSEIPNGLWETAHPKLLELKFEGWVQTRLASDPDGANEKRGVTGNNFAVGNEADLDRVIRFQGKHRPFTEPLGVKVVQAKILRPGLNTGEGVECKPMLGAEIDLLGDPKFEGRNHIVSEDGEPIDPFTICISKCNSKFIRSVIGNNQINEMSGTERRGTGRYPVGFMAGDRGLQTNLNRIHKITDPVKYFEKRLDEMKLALASIDEKDVSSEAEILRFRIEFVQSLLIVRVNETDRSFIRWRRLQFLAMYSHTISGDMLIEQYDDLGFEIVPRTEDVNSKWLIKYNFGFYDSDALASFVDGIIRIPIKS